MKSKQKFSMDHWRGNPIVEYVYVDGSYFAYEDTGQPVKDNPNRACGHCGLENTKEGHDGCFGTLPGVANACCGHGRTKEAYIVLDNGGRIEGKNALIYGLEIAAKIK